MKKASRRPIQSKVLVVMPHGKEESIVTIQLVLPRLADRINATAFNKRNDILKRIDLPILCVSGED